MTSLVELEKSIQRLLDERRIEFEKLKKEWADYSARNIDWHYRSEMEYRFDQTNIQPLIKVIRLINQQIDILEGNCWSFMRFEHGEGI